MGSLTEVLAVFIVVIVYMIGIHLWNLKILSFPNMKNMNMYIHVVSRNKADLTHATLQRNAM